MDVQWWEVVGLIGVTLVLSAGKIFEFLREWLLGFEYKLNPLRWAGELLSCSMCCGMWVGFLWGFFVEGWSWYVALIFGGCISIVSLVSDELVGLISLYRLSWAKRGQGAMTAEELVEARKKMQEMRKARLAENMLQTRARKRGTPKDITEEEAHRYMDAQEKMDDSLITGEA